MTEVITYDESGEHIMGAFYQLEIPFDFEAAGYSTLEDRNGVEIFHDKPGFLGGDAYCHVIDERQIVATCPLDSMHVVRKNLIRRSVELFALPDDATDTCLVPDVFAVAVVATQHLRDILGRSALRGIRVSPATIGENYTSVNNPSLYLVDPTSQHCRRDVTVNVPDSNTCFRCNWGPVICPSCKNAEFHCPHCGEELIAHISEHRGLNDRRFTTIGHPRRGWILDANKWDGSDYIPGADLGFVSSRFVKLLLSANVEPFAAKICRVDVSRATREVRGHIESLARIELL